MKQSSITPHKLIITIMKTKKISLLLLVILFCASLHAQPPGWLDGAISDHYFIENTGQVHNGLGTTNPDVLYYGTGTESDFGILDKVKVAHLKRNWATRWCCMLVVSAVCNNAQQTCGALAMPAGPTGETVNYYDEYMPSGVLGVNKYKGVATQGVWSNINIYYTSDNHGLVTYYEVSPGGNATDIKLKFEGQSSLQVPQVGPIVASMGTEIFTFNQLEAYQFDIQTQSLVSLGWKPTWVLTGTDEVSLGSIGAYDTYKPLYLLDVPVTPPTPAALEISDGSDWSTRYGAGSSSAGSSFKHEDGGTIRVDKVTKDIYHTMSTHSSSLFPTDPGCEQAAGGGGYDLFISKFQNGTYKRLWSTYFGGAGDESCRKMELSYNSTISDFIYLTGSVSGGNLPMPSVNNGTFIQGTNHGGRDAYVATFSKDQGIRQWVTHFGGAGDDEGMSLTIDDIDHKLYITGYTTVSPTSLVCNTPVVGKFPLCMGMGRYFQMNYGASTSDWQGFVAEFDINTNFNSLEWSTLFGGNGEEISFDVLKVNDAGTKALYITGMTQSECSGAAPGTTPPITGPAVAGDFPFANPGGACYFQHKNNVTGDDDGFIAKFNSEFKLEWSTQFGGAPTGGIQREQFTALALNKETKDIIAVGLTSTVNLGGTAYCDEVNDIWWPVCYTSTSVTVPPFGQQHLAGSADALSQVSDIMIARFSPSGKLNWSTYFGGGAIEGHYLGNHRKDDIVCARMGELDVLYVYGTSTWRRTPGLSAPVSTPTRTVTSGIHGYYYNQAKNGSDHSSENTITYGSDAFIAAFNRFNIFAYGTYFGGWSEIGGAPTVNGQADEIAKDFDVEGIDAIYLTGRQASWGTPEKAPPPPGYFKPFDLQRGDWNCFISRLRIEPWWASTGIPRVSGPETEEEKNIAIVSPNPMGQGTAQAVVELEAETPAEVGLAIYDMLGKEYYKGNFTITVGQNLLTLDLSTANMAAGMYTVKVKGNDINKTVMLIVK